MTVNVSYSATFRTQEGDITRPYKLVLTFTANDEGVRLYGADNRSRESPPDLIGPLAIPFALLGYPALTALEQVIGLKLRVIGERDYTEITFNTPAELPEQMVETTNFTIGAWSSLSFNLAVNAPPSSPDAIVSYLVTIDENSFWETVVDAADADDFDIPFDPSTYPEWPFGVASFDVNFRVRATSAAGNGPASDPELRTLNVTDITYADPADWNAVSVVDEGPSGLIDVDLEAGSGWVGMAGRELRAWAGGLPVGADAATLLPVDWATIANTVPIAVGQTVRFATGLSVGGTAYSMLLVYNPVTGRFMQGSTRKTTTVLALPSEDLPTPTSGPTITGLVSHAGTLRADIGVALSGDATWSNTNGTPARRNRFEINLVEVGTLANDAAAAYTPVAGDNGKSLTLKSFGLKDGNQVFVRTIAYAVTYPMPMVVGTIADQTYALNAGVQTIAAGTVAAAFSGTGGTFSIAGGVCTINASTGAISVPDQVAARTDVVTVTYTNSGGAASVAFTMTFAEGVQPFPPPIDPGLWTCVELTDAGEAGGIVGRIRATMQSSVTIASGFVVRIYAGPVQGGEWSATLAPLAPGGTFTGSQSRTPGTNVYPVLFYQRTADGAHATASTRPGFVTVGFVNPEPPPVTTWPGLPDAQWSQVAQQANTRWHESLNGDGNSLWFGSAMVLEAYEAFRGRSTAYAAVLSQLRYSLQGGNTPLCKGGFGTQSEIRFLCAAIMAKATPAIWSGTGLPSGQVPLNAAEKAQIDLLVKGLLIGGAYCCSTKNVDIIAGRSRIRSLTSEECWFRGNPNFSCAYPSAVHLAATYLGIPEATAFLNSLSIVDFKAQLNAQGLTNAYTVFNGLPSSGTGDYEGGEGNPKPSIPQVQAAVNNWVCATPNYNGQTMSSTEAFVISTIERTFGATVKSGVGGNAGNGWIGPGVTLAGAQWGLITTGASGLPNKGALGMALEFDGQDANGVRSALTPYVFYGARIPLDVLTAMAVAGKLNRNSSALQAAISRMHIGMTDIEYKSINGYRNLYRGNTTVYTDAGTGAHGGQTFCARIGAGSPRVEGYTLGHWFKVLKPWFDGTPPSEEPDDPGGHPTTAVTSTRWTTINNRITAGTQPQLAAWNRLIGTEAVDALNFNANPLPAYNFFSPTSAINTQRQSLLDHGRALLSCAVAYKRTGTVSYRNKFIEIINDWVAADPSTPTGDAHAGLHWGSHGAPSFMDAIDLMRGVSQVEAVLPPFRTWWYDSVVPCLQNVLTEKMLGSNSTAWELDNWTDAAIQGRLSTAATFDDAALRADCFNRLDGYFKGEARIMVRNWGPGNAPVTVVVDDITRVSDGQLSGPVQYTGYGTSSTLRAFQIAHHYGINYFNRKTDNSAATGYEQVVLAWFGWGFQGWAFTGPNSGLPIPSDASDRTNHLNILELAVRHWPSTMPQAMKNYLNSNRPITTAMRSFLTTLFDGEAV